LKLNLFGAKSPVRSHPERGFLLAKKEGAAVAGTKINPLIGDRRK
jgi:hypothetical protein